MDMAHAQEWQGAALDALAAWLGEDPGRLEPRLAQRDAVQRLVALFAAAAAAGDSEALARLLDSFLRLLRRSPKITVRTLRGPAGPGQGKQRRPEAGVRKDAPSGLCLLGPTLCRAHSRRKLCVWLSSVLGRTRVAARVRSPCGRT